VHDLAQQAPADLISLPPPLHTRPRTCRPWSASTSSRSRSSLSLVVVARALTRRCARQMLPELKDLVARGLFTRVRPSAPPADAHPMADAAQHEMQEIVKKRTAFESALVRRAPRTADFLAYVAYEARLEALRRKRVARLRAPSLSSSPNTTRG
jgi:hypothetical protein